MAVLTVDRRGLSNPAALAPVAASGGGDSFNTGSNTPVFVHVVNGHSSAQTVTFDDSNTQSPEGAVAHNPDFTVSVPNASNRLIVLRNPDRFRDASGNVNLTYSGVTALTVYVFT